MFRVRAVHRALRTRGVDTRSSADRVLQCATFRRAGWPVARFVGPFEGPRPAGWCLVCYRPASLVVRRQTLGTDAFEDRPGTWF